MAIAIARPPGVLRSIIPLLKTVKRSLDVLKRYPISSIVILGAVVFMAIFAPLIAPYDPLVGDLMERHIPPPQAPPIVAFGGAQLRIRHPGAC